jgi:glutathione S-transferase
MLDNPLMSTQVDNWVDFTQDSLSSSDFKPILSAMKTLDTHLTLRSYIVGHAISLADFAVWGALRECAGFQKLIKMVWGERR